MSAPEMSRVRQLFEQACDRPAEQRESFVRQSAGADRELAAEVMRLLESDANAGNFLESPPAVSAAPKSRGPETLGQRIGSYRVIRQLGTGGMGTVFLAVRADDAFRKTVAIKVMRSDRVGDDEVRRFRQERQVLAALDHPHIARILDGGSTDDGRPYFVMDYVDGMPIDQFADRGRLNVAQRVRLFQQVCEAVAYLHDNGIVHRDLKPSNILVTHEGNVKLLDFGIAKIRRVDEANQTVEMTGGPLMMMTPAYASPEQLRGETVTKSSDIYSLGVLLYELLTGRRPFSDDGSGLSRLGAILHGKEPPKPSTNLSEDARRAPETTSQLRRRLIGDLDAIVLMALRNQPAGRYATVEDFRLDLQRFLDGEMVIAQRDTLTTRTIRFVKRNRLAVAASVVLAFVGGFGGWQAMEARIQRERAESRESELQRVVTMLTLRLGEWGRNTVSESQKAEDVRKLREAMSNFKDALSREPGDNPERRDLMTKTVAYLSLAERLSGGSPAVQHELARTYETVADVQGNPSEKATLGDRKGAVHSYRRAATLYQAVHQASPNPQIPEQLATLNSRLTQLGVEPQPSIEAASQVQQPSEAVVSTPASTPSRKRETTREAAAAEAPASQEPEPAVVTPPAVVEPAIPAEMQQRMALVTVQVENARNFSDGIRRKLEADGLSLNSTTARQVAMMQVALDAAKAAIDKGDAAAAKENLDRADYISRQVLKYFGQ